MSSKGATQKAIYNALGISVSTWRKYKIQEQENDKNNTPIKKAMQKGYELNRDKILALCENAIQQHLTVQEITEVKKTTSNGITTITETTKKILPNPTITMFATVNASNTEAGKRIDWQSINKVEQKIEQNHHSGLKIELVDTEEGKNDTKYIQSPE